MTGLRALGDSAAHPVDIKKEMLEAASALGRHGSGGTGSDRGVAPMTSDLSIDEELALHSISWEPTELVCGVSVYSVPVGVWSWGQGEITYASSAYARSFAAAIDRIRRECAKAGGHGVVGVHIEAEVHRNHVNIALLGTAVRPVGSKRSSSESAFVSDLSGRDFTLLMASGWAPLGLAVGASFVYAPRRTAGVTIKQASQNVEMTNFTEAMYSARESAMERMQQSALALQGTGVVEVKVKEGPMSFARHAVGFAAFGTVVRLVAERHQSVKPTMILPLDDPVRQFDVTALRGEGG